MVIDNSVRLGVQPTTGVRAVSSLPNSPPTSTLTVASNSSADNGHISSLVSLTRNIPSPVVASALKDSENPKDLITSFSSSNDLAVPLIDLTREGALRNLEDMGITQFIPVSSLTSRSDQQKFVIPIMNISSLRNPSSNVLSIPHLSGVFHLGPASSSEALTLSKNSS